MSDVTPTPLRALIVNRYHDVLFATLAIPATRNALAPEVIDELGAVLHTVENDASVRALVLRGAGGVFSAGGNVGSFQARLDANAPNDQDDPIAHKNRRFGYFMQRLAELPAVLIAVVDGPTMGGGMGLACAADIVLASSKARFALSETGLGIIAAQIAPFVVERIGAAQTRRLGLTGQRLDGQAAKAIGLVDELADDSAALDVVLADTLNRVARCGPGANRRFKALVARCGHEPLSDLLDAASRQFSQCMRDEGALGIQAFKERRDPPWTLSFNVSQIRRAQMLPDAL